MIDVISHPITLLCLGVIFILCALLFFYFKRSMMVIEQAQVEQATVLRNFIASMEMKKYDQSQQYIGTTNTNPIVGGGGGHVNSRVGETDHQLIDVSDNEDDDESEEESSSDDEYVSSNGNAYDVDGIEELDDTSIDANVEESDTIKVINVEDLEDLNHTSVAMMAQDIELDMYDGECDESVSTSCDDMFSTDLDQRHDKVSPDLSEVDINQLTTTAFINKNIDEVEDLRQKHNSVESTQEIENFNAMSILLSPDDFKGYTVSQIRDYASHNNIISKGDKKMKKKELVEHVIEANIKAGAENLKVNKVGSDTLYKEDQMDVEEKPDMTDILHKAASGMGLGGIVGENNDDDDNPYEETKEETIVEQLD